MRKREQTFVDIFGVLGRGFKVQEAVETSEFFGLWHRDTALRLEVALVSYNANDGGRIGMISQFFQPL